MNIDAEQKKQLIDIERRKVEARIDAERRKLEEENYKRNMAANAAAQEPPPVNNTTNNHKNDKNEKKIHKKEEKVLDQESDSIKKSSSNDKKLMNRIDDLRQGPSRNGWMEKGPGILILLSIIAYFFDFISNFTRPPNYAVFLAYGIMIIVAVIMTKVSTKTQWIDGDFVGFFSVIAFTMIFPWVVHSFRENIPYQWVVDLLGLFLLFPPVFVYLLSKYPENSAGHKLYTGIIIFIVIYGFLQLLASPSFQGNLADGKTTITQPMDLIGGLFENVIKTGKGVVDNTYKSFQMAVAKATGQKYEGEEEEQRGILIESVKAVEKNYYTSSDIYVQGKIKATNLVGEVTVRTRCYVKDKSNGTTYPEILTMVNDDQNIIDCHLGHLPKGNYQVFVAATFVFITDADIQYYFVDEKTRPELYDKMNIPEKAMATYTGGPVEVGLPSLNQPLRLSADITNTRVGNYPFGVSLTNKWSQGKVVRGINYTLVVPNGFELRDCNRKWIGTGGYTIGQEERKAYSFRTDDQNIKETFDSVTCRMRAASPATIFNGDFVAIKTFNARAVYEYTVEGSTSINVEQDYFGG